MRKVLWKKGLVWGILLLFVTIAMNANPFSITTSAERSNWMVGVFYHANGIGSNFIARNYNDCILNVEGETNFKVTQDASNWNVITQTGGVTVDYTYATGIYFTGTQFGEYYRALAPNTIPETTDYSVEMKIQFVSGWAHAGFDFNYVDENNYGNFVAVYERSGEGGVRLIYFVDGVATQDLVKMDLSPTEYILKVDVDNTNGVLNGYLNGNLVCTLSILPVPPTEVYVDDDFTSSTPGWGYNHFSSIQDGIDAVDVGGTVYVASGTYNEPFMIPEYAYLYIEKSINLIGENRDTTIVNCPDTGSTGGEFGIRIGFHGSVVVTNVTISGFTIHGGYNSGSIGIYVQPDNSNIRIENCTLDAFEDGITLWDVTNCLVSNCTFYDNSREGGIDIAGGGNHKISGCISYSNSNGICIVNSNSNTISNCQIYDCSANGIYLYAEGGYSIDDNSFENCDVYDNTGCGIKIDADAQVQSLANNAITNCTFKRNNGDGIWCLGEHTIISDCISENNFGNGIATAGGGGHHFVISRCIVNNNSQNGIVLTGGPPSDIISYCHIENNTLAGIRIIFNIYDTDDIVYRNNLIDNHPNAFDDHTNTWYNSTLQQGNYWSDYIGEDNNHDGIGDTPYDISGGSNQDLYPFMQQDGWLLPPNQPPEADAGGPYYANVGNSITFDGSGSSDTDGTIVGYRWDWTNDGTYDTDWLTSAITTHSYLSAGTYTVKLEVKDNASGTDTDTATAYITTESGATPTAEANGPYSGYVNHPVAFSSAGSIGGSEGIITEWYWTFGDGAVSSQQNPLHTYATTGTFTVTLKVTNNFGQTNTDTTSATIQELSPNQILPIADAGGPYEGVVGTPITFDGSGSTDADGTIVSYVWNFGDSTTGTGVSPTHTYTIPGNYTVILTVTDNESLTHSDSTTADVNVSGPPTIVISVDISNIEPIEEENEKTIPITVYCYHQTVSNIYLEILEDSNLTVTLLSPNITLNPGESRELLINVKAPKLDLKGKEKVGDETIKLRAVGDGNITSNTEQINIKVVQKGATPGFELVFVLCAIGVAMFLWRKKRSV